ncbi:unnamed protein product [Pseudo-nitzschia multistriata]|uniref:Actin maturation protease n=1 Tax=Pseudo-nitzschia multistriata TaxID=183589 RepID=A0A448ZBK8_9STRA|nr:unnamed protein product [Pseudo-nitzschia multistriata]
MMPLAAHCVQTTGDLFLVRIHRRPSGEEPSDAGARTSASDGGDRRNERVRGIEAAPPGVVSSWVGKMADALQEQWPREGRSAVRSEPHSRSGGTEATGADDSGSGYYRNYIVHHERSAPSYSLACSYLLLSVPPATPGEGPPAASVVGHGRLMECYESAGGNAAAATYILVDRERRGSGYGTALLGLLEREAVGNRLVGGPYHFVYLWCKASTAAFYERRCGYARARNRVSLQRPCLKALAATSVQSLEAVLRLGRERHRRGEDGGGNGKADSGTGGAPRGKKLETVVLLPDRGGTPSATKGGQPVAEEDVWLRKRLVDHVDSVRVAETERKEEMNRFVASVSDPEHASRVWYRWNPRVPWQMQIGPSCGLTAVRMVKDHYRWPANHERDREGNQTRDRREHGCDSDRCPSLLADARARGYTQDGEVFDADHLRKLVEDQLGSVAAVPRNGVDRGTERDPGGSPSVAGGEDAFLTVRTRETASLAASELDSTLRDGGLWILPYDSHPRTKQPCRMQGKRAHWGIVVGMLVSRPCTVSQGDGETRREPPGERGSVSPLPMPPDDAGGGDEHIFEPAPQPPKTVGDSAIGATESPLHSDPKPVVYWMVQHSLSSKWAIAPMEEWVASNRQLVSFDDDKFALDRESGLNLKNKIIEIFPSRSNRRKPR